MLLIVPSTWKFLVSLPQLFKFPILCRLSNTPTSSRNLVKYAESCMYSPIYVSIVEKLTDPSVESQESRC
ncbi:hypothetical protein EUGRSUZ_C03736 [Eucalyptus grandis]|uniref:Uncharacterized protein n=2 Tax=Eucalyptus grandis TaxID=71139 RepID=A0ACC3LJH8_EUCGR|nr:hypothetical protein EUGRSUZ_C03736 [Eucalyptus grandis]